MPPKKQVSVDSEGTIIVEDPALIAELDRIYHSQVKQGKKSETESTLGYRVKFQNPTVSGEDCPGSHPVNMLCKC